MRNLNKEFKKEYFTADELVKLLIEIVLEGTGGGGCS